MQGVVRIYADRQQDGHGDRRRDVRADYSVRRNFTVRLVTVHPGQDVIGAIITFFQLGVRDVCLLSGTGYISRVDLRRPVSGGTNTFEGRFPIQSLSGSFWSAAFEGRVGRVGGISITLVHPDGRIIGGGVAGSAIAASPVLVHMGTYLADVTTNQNPGMGNPFLQEIHYPDVQDENNPVEVVSNDAPRTSSQGSATGDERRV